MTYLLHHLLDASAERRPEAVAVRHGDEALTYGALAERTNQAAHLLWSEGVRPGDRVALYLPKSSVGMTALYGILKAGAAYVPLDLHAPARRIAFILRDCGVRHLITTPPLLEELRRPGPELPPDLAVFLTEGREDEPPRGHRVVPWDAARDLPVSPPASAHEAIDEDLAYILYTSGSTGEPKGVAISHHASLAFVRWAADTLGLHGEDRLSNHAPFHFDLSVLDLFGAAAAGAAVLLIPEGVAPFPVKLAELIETERMTVWYSVPSALIRLLTAGRMERFAFRHLRLVLFAGEVFPLKYLRELMARIPHAVFYNLYGPTETNVCTYYPVPPLPPERVGAIPIGRACANTEVFALTPEGRRAEVGEAGELFVRGPTLMKGYWGRPEKTAEVLVQHPGHCHYPEPVYRTGDLVRLEEDGNYTFLGRTDHMVKSRGYRIELGEIETALYAHPDVQEATVVAIPDEEVGHRLLALVVPRDERRLTEREVQRHCAEQLPRYMIPERVEIRSALPRTSTGKVDRRRVREELLKGG